MRYMVTGAAGFIGFHLAKELLRRGAEVVGVDDLNNYYDVKLKNDRLALLKKNKNFTFYKAEMSDILALEEVFKKEKIDKVCHLAAQAGVRRSIEDPFVYEKSNILGFLNILECLKKYEIKDLVYASSSSVYGDNKKVPFSEDQKIDKPISFYAATKASNELFAHVYNHLFGINVIGLRFFTAYGPWGRPDMAYFLFADSIVKNKPIKVFNFGEMKRDFTYIDDIVDGIISALDKVKEIRYGIYNLGGMGPVKIMDFIGVLGRELGVEVKKDYMPLQQGDMVETSADINRAKTDLGYLPKVSIEVGLKEFVKWYKSYYQI